MLPVLVASSPFGALTASLHAKLANWRPALPLLLWLTVILLVKLWFAFGLPGPWFLPDEVIYLNAARRIAGGQPFADGTDSSGFQPGWPVLLAPLLKLFDPSSHLLYRVAVVTATILGTVVIIPVYCLARTWLGRPEATLVAVIPAMLPSASLYGWAALTEPLFTLILATTAILYVRGLMSGRLRYFLACAALATAALLVRPFGICNIIACVVGGSAWAIAANRKRELLRCSLRLGLAIAATFCVKRLYTGTWAITSYGTEATAFRIIWLTITTSAGWKVLTDALRCDVVYLFLGGLGVVSLLASVSAARTIVRAKSLSPAQWGVSMGTATLVITTLILSGLMRRVGVPERFYGRYLDPLWVVLIPAAAVAWQQLPKSRPKLLLLTTLLLVGTVASVVDLPQGHFTFTNNAGIWCWRLLVDHLGPLWTCAVPIALLSLFVAFRNRRAVAWATVTILTGLSTVAVAQHIRQVNNSLLALRSDADHLAQAVYPALSQVPTPHIWFDPRLLSVEPDMETKMLYLAWLLRYQLPGVPVTFVVSEQTVPRSDFLLTFANLPTRKPRWSNGFIALYTLD